MPSALKRALALDPIEMRAHVARRFSVDHMVSGYLAAYASVMKRTHGIRPLRALPRKATYPPATVAPVAAARTPRTRANAPKLGLGGDTAGEFPASRTSE